MINILWLQSCRLSSIPSFIRICSLVNHECAPAVINCPCHFCDAETAHIYFIVRPSPLGENALATSSRVDRSPLKSAGNWYRYSRIVIRGKAGVISSGCIVQMLYHCIGPYRCQCIAIAKQPFVTASTPDAFRKLTAVFGLLAAVNT
jgi:hypothetical protein